jgi:hypothetical protein
MDFYQVVERLQPKLQRLVKILNDPAISPELRKRALAAAFTQIGQSIYGSAYRMTAYDFEIMETIGSGLDPQLALGLARNISDSIAIGDLGSANDQVAAYAVNATGIAMTHATLTAGDLGKYRTLQIHLRGKGDCDWCRAKARKGKIVNPTAEDFHRHTNCNCFYDVQGFRSRNGELKNYRPALAQ